MKIVSLLPSATEIVCALGTEKLLVGRSHECDFPASVKRLPVCTRPRLNPTGHSREIDDAVKNLLREGLSVYDIFTDVLLDLRPDLLLTQAHCEVCAVSFAGVEQSLSGWPGKPPRVLSLSPTRLEQVWESIVVVADALDMAPAGRTVVQSLRARVDAVASKSATLPRPTVTCIEWLDPLMCAGNWVPELVALAGGKNLFSSAGEHSDWMKWEKIARADPDVVISMPCGFDLERTVIESRRLSEHPGWRDSKAVRGGRVYAVDGNQFFNRPGPRLVESLEILAEILHPDDFRFGHQDRNWHPLPKESLT